jgi:hypothetical protein
VKKTFELINQMQADGVIREYAIGGAVGATFYLEPSATLDVDIFVSLGTDPGGLLVSLAPIYDYLKSRGCKVDAEHIIVGDWPVQFLAASDALELEALEQTVATQVEGERTHVMSAEHLAAIALRTGRPKDFARLLQFLEPGVLDVDKMKTILSRHGLTPKWEQFERRYLR